MRWGVIGCGLIGKKRAIAARDVGEQVVAVCDLKPGLANALALDVRAAIESDWKTLVARDDIDAIVVATSHDGLSPIAVASLDHGKHVLVEKPAGRNLAEVKAVADAAKRNKRIAKAGFNHRFHPAFQKAHAIAQTGEMGPLKFIRGRYGHGGRIGYEKEWRFKREISGGGELVDQGSHLIDLAQWFLGDFTRVQATLRNFFWAGEVEDNCFLTLSTAGDEVAWLHASWTEWKNMFSFEIYGTTGKLQIDGLGGSYGTEALTYYRMLPQMGPPETTRWDWPQPDKSWESEVSEFVKAIAENRRPLGDIEDALLTMSVIERAYGQRP
jgi:predicted dehydrogenase